MSGGFRYLSETLLAITEEASHGRKPFAAARRHSQTACEFCITKRAESGPTRRQGLIAR